MSHQRQKQHEAITTMHGIAGALPARLNAPPRAGASSVATSHTCLTAVHVEAFTADLGPRLTPEVVVRISE